MLALVRAVPSSFPDALVGSPLAERLDVDRARAQHAAYVAALAGLGVETIAVPTDDACPDCCFIEDTAVVVGRTALVTRPGAPSRRAEVGPVHAALGAAGLRVEVMEAPATLDGGDCLLAGDTMYIGRSARSNDAGIARLVEVFPGLRVVPVEMPPGVLHLKSVCSPLAGGAVLVAEGTVPATLFPRAVVVPRAEAHAANAVAVPGAAAALVAAGCPATAALIAAAGLTPVPVDTSELRRADGALTCLSILC